VKTGSFKDLIVWQKAYKLVLETYKATRDFPKHEVYGLSQPTRRAAVSIPSNIAEGYSRRNKGEYIHFLSLAYSSLAELETQYLLSKDLKYLKKNDIVKGLLGEIGRILYRLMHPIR